MENHRRYEWSCQGEGRGFKSRFPLHLRAAKSRYDTCVTGFRGFLLLVVLLLLSLPTHAAADGPCTGFSPPRWQVEGQSWWAPQIPSGHVGHIHIKTCFPILQTVMAADVSIPFEVIASLHHMDGIATKARLEIWQQRWSKRFSQEHTITWSCPGLTCAQTFQFQVPVSKLKPGFWHEARFHIITKGFKEIKDYPDTYKDSLQYTTTRWPFAYSKMGATLPFPKPEHLRLGAAGWYFGYQEVGIHFEDFPFAPVSGVWSPRVRFDGLDSEILIDPALHAVPPDPGLIVYQGPKPFDWTPIAIDTTLLTNGWHRLFLRSGEVGQSGNSGVFVVWFEVQNG